jgi:hypothetical protein
VGGGVWEQVSVLRVRPAAGIINACTSGCAAARRLNLLGNAIAVCDMQVVKG